MLLPRQASRASVASYSPPLRRRASRWHTPLQGSVEANVAAKMAYVARLRTMPIASNTPDANEQHYEVPTEYYLRCLGKHLKYSSCYYPPGAHSARAGAEA